MNFVQDINKKLILSNAQNILQELLQNFLQE